MALCVSFQYQKMELYRELKVYMTYLTPTPALTNSTNPTLFMKEKYKVRLQEH